MNSVGRTRSGVSHGEDTGASVPQVEVLVLELLAVDALTTGALCCVSQLLPQSCGIESRTYVAAGEVTSLEHELGDDAVEVGALVVEGLAGLAGALLAGAESAEVLGGLSLRISQSSVFEEGAMMKSLMAGQVRTLGTWSAKSSMTMRPAGEPSMVISKKTWGLDIVIEVCV